VSASSATRRAIGQPWWASGRVKIRIGITTAVLPKTVPKRQPIAIVSFAIGLSNRQAKCAVMSDRRARLRNMDAALATVLLAREPAASWAAHHAPPRLEFAPLTRAELDERFRGGEVDADHCEKLLLWAVRVRSALDLATAEGLHSLKQGNRLAELGYHLYDYAREVLDLGETTTRKLAKLGAALPYRPLLRPALRSGRIRICAAELVLAVAVGEAEARWVERAAKSTVRELQAAVRRARAGAEEPWPDEEWLRLRTHLPPLEREVLDLGLEVAGHVVPGSSRLDRLEAMTQEFLAGFSDDGDEDETRPLGPGFRRIGEGDGPRRAALEQETERWAMLPAIPEIPAIAVPDLRFDATATAQEVDAGLRTIAELRAGWDDLVGWCAHVIRRSGIHVRLGFATFRHYVEERLGLPVRTVEQRERLEKRLWESPALREARRQKLSYEKLRVLSGLKEHEIDAWTSRAHALTCIELRREVEGDRERQMRAARKLSVPMPRRFAVLLAAAVRTVRERAGRALPVGKCLSVIAWHFIETWKGHVQPSRSRSQKVRERDLGQCQVPGCSHRAVHSHHIVLRSHGGSDDPANQVALCAFHHLRCIHGGYLRVVGTAPDRLRWFLNGKEWTGVERREDSAEG
jgi:hypothetical protein